MFTFGKKCEFAPKVLFGQFTRFILLKWNYKNSFLTYPILEGCVTRTTQINAKKKEKWPTYLVWESSVIGQRDINIVLMK